jgi:hypothetical protein
MNKGDRIELVSMGDDPCPIEPGTRGTLDNIVDVDLGDGPFKQLWVHWDDGRTLSPVIPPDEVRVLSPRSDPDEAYRAFMSMGPDEWHGCVSSALNGGCFESQEQIGFERALDERGL